MSIYTLAAFVELSLVGQNDLSLYTKAITNKLPDALQLATIRASVDTVLLQDAQNVASWCRAEIATANQDATIQARLTAVESTIAGLDQMIVDIMAGA